MSMMISLCVLMKILTLLALIKNNSLRRNRMIDPRIRLRCIRKLLKKVRCINIWGRRFIRKTSKKQFSLMNSFLNWFLSLNLGRETQTWEKKWDRSTTNSINWPVSSKKMREWFQTRLWRRMRSTLIVWERRRMSNSIKLWGIAVIKRMSGSGSRESIIVRMKASHRRTSLMTFSFLLERMMSKESRKMKKVVTMNKFNKMNRAKIPKKSKMKKVRKRVSNSPLLR